MTRNDTGIFGSYTTVAAAATAAATGVAMTQTAVANLVSNFDALGGLLKASANDIPDADLASKRVLDLLTKEVAEAKSKSTAALVYSAE